MRQEADMPQIYIRPKNMFTDNGRVEEVSAEEYDRLLAEYGDLSGRAAAGTASAAEAARLMDLCVMLGADTEPARRAIAQARVAERIAATEAQRAIRDTEDRVERCVAAIEAIGDALATLEAMGAAPEILPPEPATVAPEVRPDTNLTAARAIHDNARRDHGKRRERYMAAAEVARKKLPADLMRRAAALMDALAEREGAAEEAARVGLDAVKAEARRRAEADAQAQVANDPATILDLMRRLSDLEARQA